MQSSNVSLVQAQLEQSNPNGGKTVFMTWIPKDLKSHNGSVLTNRVTGSNWKVALQYMQTIDESAGHDDWKLAQ